MTRRATPYTARHDARMTNRILAYYDNASADNMAQGLNWYDDAQQFARALASGSYMTLEHGAGIIAALSPRVTWRSNMAGATAMVRAAAIGAPMPTVAGYGANARKAWRIANGEHPSAVLGGRKVTAFYANILGDMDRVTVDVWAARAAEGRSDDRAPNGARYSAIAAAYIVAADLRGITPAVMQATVWCAIRRGGA